MSRWSAGPGLTQARVRLLAALVALGFISAGAVGLALINDYSGRTAEVRDEIARDAATSATYIQSELDRQQGALVLIANAAVVRGGDVREIQRLFSRVQASGTLTNDLWQVSSNGIVVAATSASTGLFLGDRRYVAQALAGENVIGDAITGRSSSRPIVPLGVPVVMDGQVIGAVFTQAPLDDPDTFGQALSFLTRDASIRSEAGVTIYSDGPVKSLETIEGAQTGSPGDVTSTVTIPGTPGWTITVSEPSASAYSEARTYLVRGLSAVGVALLVVLMLLWRSWLTISRLREREQEARQKLQVALDDQDRQRRSAEQITQIALGMERHQGYSERADALLGWLLTDFADFAIIEADNGLAAEQSDQPVTIRVRHIDPSKTAGLAEFRRDFFEAEPPHKEMSGRRFAGRPFRLDAAPPFYAHHAHGRALELLEELQPGSMLGVPLRTAHGGRASLVVGRTYGQPDFSDADLEFLESLGPLTGLVLETGRLHDSDRHRSLYLQENLLPAGLPENDGFCLATRYIPGEQGAAAGGDWYDAYRMPGPHLLLTVGDVVGHGVEAAAAMGKLRSALRALAEATSDPALILQRLDRLAAPMRSAQFSTAFVGVLNIETGHLAYSNAGHPLPVLSTQSGTTMLEGTADLPLTVEPRRRNVADVQLEDGDVLLLYTDGLIETRTDDLIEQEDILRSIVDKQRNRPLPALLDDVLLGLQPEGFDDVCLLVARWVKAREAADTDDPVEASASNSREAPLQ